MTDFLKSQFLLLAFLQSI